MTATVLVKSSERNASKKVKVSMRMEWRESDFTFEEL